MPLALQDTMTSVAADHLIEAESVSPRRHSTRLRIGFLIPAIALIVATTMVPTNGLRHPSLRYIDATFNSSDFLNNILLFLPLGFALGGVSLLRAFLVGLCLSTCAETLQLGFVDRIPSPFDITSNTCGAVLGHVVAVVWLGAIGSIPRFLRVPKWMFLPGVPLALLGMFMLLHHRTVADFSNWDSSFDVAAGKELTGGRLWNGSLAKAELYPFAASSSQIKEIAAAGLSPDAPNPFGGATPLLRLNDVNKPVTVNLSTEQKQALYGALTKSNRLTLLTWMTTHSLSQEGPARIVTYSLDPFERNFTLGQFHSTLTFRLRTPVTGPNGMYPALFTGPVLSLGRQTFVAVVYDGHVVRMYIDGKSVAREDLGANRPHLPGKLLRKLPPSVPIPEIELSLAEIVLTALFASGLFAIWGIADRFAARVPIGVASGLLVGGTIWFFGVSSFRLGFGILLECVAAGVMVAAALSPERVPTTIARAR